MRRIANWPVWVKIAVPVIAGMLIVGGLAALGIGIGRNTASIEQLEQVKSDLARDNYARAVSACESSAENRSLWHDVDELFGLATATSERARRVHERIHRFTDTNPNCSHLPPKP